MTESCVFCRIVDGSIPTAKVAEEQAALAFLTIEPATEGHTLVIPKAHSRNLFDIPEADLAAVVRMAQNIGRLQRERLGCEGVTLLQANEQAGFQTVFHFHVHVIPRWKGDAVQESWHATAVELSRLEHVARKLRA
jgi:histidine triad (HIT) family protein